MHAAAVDTVRTANAIDQLNGLIAKLPEKAQAGLSMAISKVTLTHRRAVAQLSADTSSGHVGAAAKTIAAADLAADIRGQRHAVGLLQAIAPLLPAQAQQGIANALEAIGGSLDAQATRMAKARASAHGGCAQPSRGRSSAPTGRQRPPSANRRLTPAGFERYDARLSLSDSQVKETQCDIE